MPARPARASRPRPPPTAEAGGEIEPEQTSGRTQSLWHATHRRIRTRPLEEDESGDVGIVGAGLAGLTTAYLLAEAGKDVVVLEDGDIGSGETGRTTAHFTNALDDRYHRIAATHGRAAARVAAQSHTRAIEEAARIVQQERIRCHMDRVDGYLFRHPSDGQSALELEHDACRAAGLDVGLVERTPHFDGGRALRFPDQVQLHILEYLDGLQRAVQRMGGRIYTGTHAKFPKSGLEANGHKVKAAKTVVTTNSPVTTRLGPTVRMAPVRTYVIAAPVPKDVPLAMWWDTGDHDDKSPFPPYHYVRVQRLAGGTRMLISGGEDHRTGTPHDAGDGGPFAQLEAWTRERFPEMGEVAYAWSGQCFEPADHLAYIGRDPVERARFLATGDSGNGMTHATLAGIIIRDLVLGKRTRFADLYDPSRKVLRATGKLARAALAGARPLLRHVEPSDVSDAASIPSGQGAVLGHPPKAVHRDDESRLVACTAVCPHLKSVVAWNPIERSWDCPSHGSRFTAHGEVVCGPANGDLERAKLDDGERGDRRKITRAPRRRRPPRRHTLSGATKMRPSA